MCPVLHPFRKLSRCDAVDPGKRQAFQSWIPTQTRETFQIVLFPTQQLSAVPQSSYQQGMAYSTWLSDSAQNTGAAKLVVFKSAHC